MSLRDRLRILMVIDAPWDRTLGASRIQIELAEQFEGLGHVVDHFAYEDAYPHGQRAPRLAGFTQGFPRHAARHIRAHAGDYDVIDARHGSLVAAKQSLGFSGLLVLRSSGLLAIYEREFLAEERRRGHGRSRRATRPFRWAERRVVEHGATLAFARADLLNVLNSDEEAYCIEKLRANHKTVMLRSGLARERMASFLSARQSVSARMANPRVAFVGSWSRRKGAGDMATIVAVLRERVPDASFSFLGTGATTEQVLADLGTGERGILVRPRFESDELPSLLAGATVGMLPSYVEGFPFSVVEMLAAGLPVVAYDAPGARDIMPALDASLLVPPGDARALAKKLAGLLGLDPGSYARLSNRATMVADGLRWEEIAESTIAAYRRRLAAIGG